MRLHNLRGKYTVAPLELVSAFIPTPSVPWDDRKSSERKERRHWVKTSSETFAYLKTTLLTPPLFDIYRNRSDSLERLRWRKFRQLSSVKRLLIFLITLPWLFYSASHFFKSVLLQLIVLLRRSVASGFTSSFCGYCTPTVACWFCNTLSVGKSITCPWKNATTCNVFYKIFLVQHKENSTHV